MTTTACAPDRLLGTLPSGRGLRWLWVTVAAFGLQLVAIHVVASLVSDTWLGVSLVASHAALLPFIVVNRRLVGIAIVAFGLSLNLAVMIANGGLMPVSPTTVDQVGRHQVASLQPGHHVPGTKNVLLERSETRLAVLSDGILIEAPKPLRKAISVGDIFVYSGVILTLGQVAYSWSRRSTKGS